MPTCSIRHPLHVCQCKKYRRLQQMTHLQDLNKCYRRMSIKQSWCKIRHNTILDIKRWQCDDQWSGYERQMNCNTAHLQLKGLEQFQSNHMSIEKTRPLVWESPYQLNMNEDIKEAVKRCSTYIEFQSVQPKNSYTPWNPRQTMGDNRLWHFYP